MKCTTNMHSILLFSNKYIVFTEIMEEILGHVLTLTCLFMRKVLPSYQINFNNLFESNDSQRYSAKHVIQFFPDFFIINCNISPWSYYPPYRYFLGS